MGGAYSKHGVYEICHRGLVLKPKEKPQFGTLRHRRKDNFKMDVQECCVLVTGSIRVYIGASDVLFGRCNEPRGPM
jgi:hypothetical protein